MNYLFSILLLLPSGFGQDATVTFYSMGSTGKTGLKVGVTLGVPGKMPFAGWVFDGDHKLARLQPGHFMTLHLASGEHVFSGTFNSKHPAANALLPLTLAADQHYFVRLTGEHNGILVVLTYKGFIQQVDCETARQEASGAEPIKANRVEKDVRDSLADVAHFPRCK